MTRLLILSALLVFLTACAPVVYSPDVLREQAAALETQQAQPYVLATQAAAQTQTAYDRQLYADSLTATASANAQATQHAEQTAIAQAQMTLAAVNTQQAEATQIAAVTATAQATGTQIAMTQEAFRIQEQAKAEQVKAWNRLIWTGLAAVVLAVIVVIGVRLFDEYLQDRRTKRQDESIRARLIPREGQSPLFVTKDERPLDPDKAFHPDVTQPAPSVEHQERVTQRAQAVQLAGHVAKALSAAPGTHTANYLASLMQQQNGTPQLPAQVNFLEQPPAYAEELEAQLLEKEGTV